MIRTVKTHSRRFSARRCLSSTAAPPTARLPVSPSLRNNLIFGANTDVGKTLVSTGLVRASLSNSSSAITQYIKPLQCGGSDAGFVERHCQQKGENESKLRVTTLFEWESPTSPHVASRLENKPISDDQVLSALVAKLAASDPNTTTYVETAGGVLSPSCSSPENTRPSHAHSDGDNSWGWRTQGDLYQPLLGQLPVVLVGDGRLGGISVTLSALESLIVRGYDVAALILIATEQYDNVSALREYASRKLALRSGCGESLFPTPMQSIVSLPPIPSDPLEPLDEWFANDQVTETFAKLDGFLANSWQGQVQDLQSLRSAGKDCLWWPFTQHGNLDDNSRVTHVDSANGDDYIVLKDASSGLERVPMFDACASWWTQGVGHGDSTMALASAAAAGRYGHVIFPEVVHSPAVALSQKLLGPKGPGHGWASRVFFTDDGSTAMEVSIKMGLKLYQTRMVLSEDERDEIEWMVCAQSGCYHGDTLGVMDVAEPSIFNEGQTPWYEPKGLFLDTPTLGYRDGTLQIFHPDGWEPTNGASSTFDSVEQAMDVPSRIISRSLFSHYKETIELQWLVYEHSGGPRRKIGCVVIEPVLMGAGGMKFVDPLWQRALMDIAEARSVPVVFDEVASGLHRVGVASCREIIQADPDIASYAKLLTGGLLPMSVTLATAETFNAFLGDEKGQALLHGHSYTAHPVGCVSALHALETYDSVLADHDRKTGPRMWFDNDQVKALSCLPLVENVFSLGTVLAVTLKSEDGAEGYGASSRTVPIVQNLRNEGIYARPLGNVVYIMVSPLTSSDECARLASNLHKHIENFNG